MFELAGYTDDGRPADRPTEPVLLYRASTAAHRRRWSWTGTRRVAERFAEVPGQLGADVTVWRAVVEPWRLFAHIGEAVGRGEDEYVIDASAKGLRVEAAS